MTTYIQKWGNSQGVRIPKSLLERLNLAENEAVELIPGDGEIIIRKSRRHKSFEERMAGYDGSYEFTEMDAGGAAGREVF